MGFAQAFKNFKDHIPLEPFHPASFDLIGHYNARSLTRDISSGLTVGMVALPLAMAFAIASGVTPEAGIYTSIIAGFLIAILGGCRVQIGGPAGAFIVIIYGIIANYGLANLMIATIGSGILLILMGLFKIGSFIRFIFSEHPGDIRSGKTHKHGEFLRFGYCPRVVSHCALLAERHFKPRGAMETMDCQNPGHRYCVDRLDSCGHEL